MQLERHSRIPFLDKYRNFVTKKCHALDRRKYTAISWIIGLIFLEFKRIFTQGLLCIIGLKKKNFHLFHLNPKKLNRRELDQTPILLVHGNLQNHGIWLPLAKYLAKKKQGPVFTVDIPVGFNHNPRQASNVIDKMREITSLYQANGKTCKIDLIGFSLGASVVREVDIKLKNIVAIQLNAIDSTAIRSERNLQIPKIRKLIALGGPIPSFEAARSYAVNTPHYYEMIASYDPFIPSISHLDPSNRSTVRTTHLGLPTSKKTARKIVHCLNQ